MAVENSLPYKGIKNELNQFVLIDWFQATILSKSFDYDDYGVVFGVADIKPIVIFLFDYLFNIPSSELIFENKGINGYNINCHYKDIYIMWCTNRPDMGIHIKMSGSGCRCFEELNLDYIEFFKKLYNYQINFNRIDISIDDFSDTYFTLSKLFKYVKSNSVSSKFISCLNIQKLALSDSSSLGHTLQFGSKASNLQITFYDKLKERESQNYIVNSNIKFWTRTELRFRHDYAKQVIDKILIDKDINKIIKSILKEYISFKSKESRDSNISRRSNVKWWDSYINNLDYLTMINYVPESSISRKNKWLENSVSKSLFMVYISKLDNLNTDTLTNALLLKLFQFGFDKFSADDLKIINQYRIDNDLIPFTESELFSYVNDLNEYFQIHYSKNSTSYNLSNVDFKS